MKLELLIKILNNLKKKILAIAGGISEERLISLDTGKQVANFEFKKMVIKLKFLNQMLIIQKAY